MKKSKNVFTTRGNNPGLFFQLFVIVLVGIASLFLWQTPVQMQEKGKKQTPAAVAPNLGTAAGFSVLAGSTVTNTGQSVVTGDLGVSPGSAVTGFPPGIVTGTIRVNDAVAAQAKSDAGTAYNNLAGQACDTILTGQNLGGLTLTPGVYCFASSAQLTGVLRLDTQGNPDAVFIFKMGSTLTTASDSVVRITDDGNICNVFWQVGSSATLGTNTLFGGNILALTSITATTGANINGRAIALNGAVTMDTNNIAKCAAEPPPPPCTPSTTVSEGDLFPGGIVSFGVFSGPNSVTVDHVNAGTGLQSFTVVGTPINAVVNIPSFTPGTFNPVTATFTENNPGQVVDFTLRAASLYHSAFIRVRCN